MKQGRYRATFSESLRRFADRMAEGPGADPTGRRSQNRGRSQGREPPAVGCVRWTIPTQRSAGPGPRALVSTRVIDQTLSHYRIAAKLGEGGMGEVYRAEDTRLRRAVALKVLPAELAGNQERLERFRREAEALASLDHPNIVTIYSVEEDRDLHFLTMQLVEGATLSEQIGEGALPVDRVIEIGESLADALRAAHDRGVIHRDLKPANVMIDAEGRVKILDFGLAKLRQTGVEDGLSQLSTQAMTQGGMVLGTVPYMSPEQVQGLPVDHRTDLFSFGILLYELLTGRRPFGGASAAAIAGSLMRDTPSPVAEIRPDVPQALSEIVERCLAKDPDERFQCAADVRDALRELAVMLATGAGTGRATIARPAAARPRRTRLATLVAVIVLAVLGALVTRRAPRPSPGRKDSTISSLVVLPLENLSGDPGQDYFVDGMTEALITDLSKIGALKVISRSSAMRYKGTDKTLSQIAAELGVDAVIEGSVLREGDRVGISAQLIEIATETNLWAERYERDLTSMLRLQGEIAQAIAREVQVKLTPQEAELLAATRDVDPRVHEAYLQGMFHIRRFTPQDLATATGYFETALELEPDYALAHYGLSQALNYSFVLGIMPPNEAGPRALAAVRRALELDDTLAEAHLGLANLKTSYEWDWDGAEREFRRAIELNPNYAEARVFFSHLLLILGRIDEADEQIALGLELDPLEPFYQAAHGVLLAHSGRYEEAIALFQRIYENTPGFGFAHQPFWRVLHEVGRLDEALEQARIHLTNVGEPEAVAALEAGLARGGYREATRSAAEVLAAGSRLATARPIIIAALYDDAGETEKALDWIERSYENRDIDMAYLGTLMLSEPVRSHPRFRAVLERLGTPLLPH
jgi:TolB-like protein/Tfp pilus assembly protein PilF